MIEDEHEILAHCVHLAMNLVFVRVDSTTTGLPEYLEVMCGNCEEKWPFTRDTEFKPNDGFVGNLLYG